MKKNIFPMLLVFMLALPTIGCSAEETEKKAETEKTEAVDSISANPADSLAVKRFPVRNEANAIVAIETDYGKMVLELYRDVAPGHADSFVARTNQGFYNGLIFHRIVKNFMIQGGDPLGTGAGNAGYFLQSEFSDLPHMEGTLSMARSNSPHSASSQFFVCLARTKNTAYLDGKYTVFGQLLKGYDALHAIGNVECLSNGREVSKPKEEIVMRKVYLCDAEGNPLK